MEVLEIYCHSLLGNTRTDTAKKHSSKSARLDSLNRALEKRLSEKLDQPQSQANQQMPDSPRSSPGQTSRKLQSSRARLLSELNSASNELFDHTPRAPCKKQAQPLSTDPTLVAQDSNHQAPTVTAFICNKGGTGKTTACINIAGWLAKQGKRVLIIDLDPQRSASSYISEEDNANATCSSALLLNTALTDLTIPNAFDNIDILPADASLLMAERDMQINQDSPQILSRQLQSLNALTARDSAYDYIFLDTPAGVGLTTLSAAVSADNIVLPMDNSTYSERACEMLLTLFGHCEKYANRRPELALVLLKQQTGNYLERVLKEDQKRISALLEQYSSRALEITAIPYSASCQRAARANMTMAEYAPVDKLSRAFQRAARVLDIQNALCKTANA